ncbi:hypothetical protein NH287_14735 [Microbacterium sp. CnD16-F]|uniref:hypothetical protein n=1 Tax=unclassified Microbacterium TaxID=2609290 RepID=UPI00209713DB|nr:hypothetical protein [Microbacterium sp. CnD16-F]MCO7204744.1 hypothetical protein [Microbacterium sp. CnD16-F]
MSLRRIVLPVLAVTALLLTACAPTEFAREQTAADRPDAVVDGVDGAIDVATLRYVGKADAYDVYLARAAGDGDSLCLSLTLDDAWQTTACARDSVSVQISDSASVAADLSYRSGEDRDMISDNVWVNRK